MDTSEAQGNSRTALPNFPVLDSPAKCAALWPRYPQKVVGMWATGLPRQNVDVLWRLREELLKLGVPVVFFFNESAWDMLRKVATDSSGVLDIYQLDNTKYFRMLNFVDVLVTNDYLIYCEHAKHIKAKLVGMPHHANVANPTFWNYFYDYFVSDRNELSTFDYSFYPDRCKIHREAHFTQLVVGHPKIDLILEERQKNVPSISSPVLLLYPNYVPLSIAAQNLNDNKYVEIWSDIVSSFLAWCPDGIVVFRPPLPSRDHAVVRELKARFADDGRFFIDEEADNKFWIARADYFLTDTSDGFVNFCMTAKRPAIRMRYKWKEQETIRDEWGWVISGPRQFIPLLEELNRDEKQWQQALIKKQRNDMPTLGRTFLLLADIIRQIFKNEDPGGLKLDKGHTPCDTSLDMLKIVAKWGKYSNYSLSFLSHWLNAELIPAVGEINPKIWLQLLRRALRPYPGRDSPDQVAKDVDSWLGNALESLPFRQSVGLMRHLLHNYPEDAASALFMTITSSQVCGSNKKRALFFLLVEWARYNPEVVKAVSELAQQMPQHFSKPVLDKLNRFLPLAMKVPLPLRRFAACILGLKKTLARKYWQAHRKLA